MTDNDNDGRIFFDDEHRNRTELDETINWFALQPAPSRREFLDKFKAGRLDRGGRELLGILNKLHFELAIMHREDADQSSETDMELK